MLIHKSSGKYFEFCFKCLERQQASFINYYEFLLLFYSLIHCIFLTNKNLKASEKMFENN